jgi:hypothetical protein
MGNALGGDYALDFLTIVRQVATKMERARPAPVSIEDLVRECFVPQGDLSRVMSIEAPEGGEYGAKQFLVEHAIEAVGAYRQDDGYILPKPLAELRYEGQVIHPSDERPRLDDPFNPMRGKNAPFLKNLRAGSLRDQMGKLDELRWSMREWGWLHELGRAIKDERDVVLIGHRRLAVAEELGITETTEGKPVCETVRFGSGNDADVKRVRMALASNLGQKPLTREDRRKITQVLYHDDEWTETRIAEALQVSVMTVHRDLTVGTENNTAINSVPSKPTRGRGAPKKRSTPEQDAKVVEMADQGIRSREKIAAATSLSLRQVQDRLKEYDLRKALGVEAKPEQAERPALKVVPPPLPPVGLNGNGWDGEEGAFCTTERADEQYKMLCELMESPLRRSRDPVAA